MASLKVFDRSGKEVGSYDVDPKSIAPRINKQLLHDVIVMYQANGRQGSASTRSRAQVSGSTKKMYRQKGTGNARAGSRRSGVRRGGGHIFAKKPRDFSYRLPRKAVQAATRMAIASKIQDDQMVVIDDLAFDAPATKEMAGILKSLGLDRATTLVTIAEHNPNVYKSARNIADVSVSPVSDLNALAVLKPRRMLVTKSALDAICKKRGCQGEQEKLRVRRMATAIKKSKSKTSSPSTMTLESHQVILRPLVTEKGMHRSSRDNQYGFEINPLATKDDVRRAVEDCFDVKVLKVRTQNRKGKPRRYKFRYGFTKNWKKAIVTLDSEHRIDFF